MIAVKAIYLVELIHALIQIDPPIKRFDPHLEVRVGMEETSTL